MNYSTIDILMKSDDSSDRRVAATMLGEYGDEPAAIDRLVELLKDTNGGVRDASQSALMFLGGRNTVEKVAPLVGTIDPGLRNAAIDILRKVGDDGIDVLHRLAVDKNPDIRLFVLDILGTIGNPESVDVLIGGLTDADPNIRNAAIVSLGLLGDPKAFTYIKPLIEDEEWIRFSAIEALSQIPHEDTAGFLLEQLERWSLDELTVSALLETISKIKPKQCVNALITMLETANAYIETEIVKALLKILSPDEIASLPEKDAHVIKTIIDMHLNDVEEELLSDMLEVLPLIGDKASVQAMIELARSTDPDTHPEKFGIVTDALCRIGDIESMVRLLDAEDKLQILAANVLAGIGKDEGAQRICERVFSAQGYVKRAMTDALASIGGASLCETFRRLLTDTDGHVISSSLLALARNGNTDDISVMEPYLSHKYPDVCETALMSIVMIGTERAEEVFMHMASDTDRDKRIMGLRGLGLMESPSLHQAADRLLNDENWEVRAEAVKVIRDKDLQITTDMLKSLLADTHEQIRYAALDIIGMKKVEGFKENLHAAIDGDDMWAASHAIESLGNFKDDSAKAKLLDLLTCGSDFLKISAIKTIAEWGDEALAAELEEYIDDPNPDVARAIVDAIDRLQGVSF
jgi:HEAT repeat protein